MNQLLLLLLALLAESNGVATSVDALCVCPGNEATSYKANAVGKRTQLIADLGRPPPTPILHSVTIEDIQDNGDGDTGIVTLRWSLSEPDDCQNTIHFSVIPSDPTHCGSCKVGREDPEMQEEIGCQVIQGIGQSCTYRVFADYCGDPQNGVMSEPLEVNVPEMTPVIRPASSFFPIPTTTSTHTPLPSP